MAFKPVIPRKYGTPVTCVSALIDSHGTIEDVATRLDCSPQSVYGYASEAGQPISFAKVAALTDHAHPAAAEYLAARAGGIFTPLEACKGRDGMELTANAMRSHGKALAAAIDALSDGKVTHAEAEKVLADIDATLCDLAALRALYMEARGAK